MPTRTSSTRSPASRRATPARRSSTPSSRRSSTTRRGSAQRRGLAGGWLQRRQPEPKGVKKAISTARGAVPSGKGGVLAAAGLALAGVAGAALRKRSRHEETPEYRATTTPPVSGPPTNTVTTPPNTSA
jgi:hypothetical protein